MNTALISGLALLVIGFIGLPMLSAQRQDDGKAPSKLLSFISAGCGVIGLAMTLAALL